jgi:hypothetical protein
VRILVAAIVLLAFVATAHAGDPLKPYVGRIVISPEKPPTFQEELPAYLGANEVKDNDYHLIKGPPWPMWIVGVVAKPMDKPHVLVVFDKADPKNPLLAFDVTPKRRFVIVNAEATIAAGFAAGKSYVVQIKLGKTVVAKAQLTLRD